MKPVLLDVNPLIALLWPAHEHHEPAHRWFNRVSGRRWATCPLTELAFVRIVSDPAFSSDALTPMDALLLLDQNLEHCSHVFWPDDLPVRPSVFKEIGQVEGHRQVTDGYLLALAAMHRGVLATFDRGLGHTGSGGLKNMVELVPSG